MTDTILPQIRYYLKYDITSNTILLQIRYYHKYDITTNTILPQTRTQMNSNIILLSAYVTELTNVNVLIGNWFIDVFINC